MARKKHIFIPLLYRYYLWDYFKFLIPVLLRDGFAVTLYTFDDDIEESYQHIEHPDFHIQRGALVLRYFVNRSGRIVHRVGLWLTGWLWGVGLKLRYDFAIPPWDARPLWHIVSRSLPSMSISNVTSLVDPEEFKKEYSLALRPELVPNLKLWRLLDTLLLGRYLPRCNGDIVWFNWTYHIDCLMGLRGLNAWPGFSGVTYFSVMGQKIADNYQAAGLGKGFTKRTSLRVVGSPSYEPLWDIRAKFQDSDRKEMLESLDLSPDRPVFTLFLSPNYFTAPMIDEIELALKTIYGVRSDVQFILKFHPKADKGQCWDIVERCRKLGCPVKGISDYYGEEHNARLILSSTCLVQKQCTVGYIALIYRWPMISYNLIDTDYCDDMYKHLGGSYHAETSAQLEDATNKILESGEDAVLRKMQDQACANYCVDEPSPCGRLSKIISDHFA